MPPRWTVGNLALVMQSHQYRISPHAASWNDATIPDAGAQLVLAFGPPRVDGAPEASWFAAFAERYPAAARVYCSAGGQIAGTDIVDDDVVVTAVRFDHGHVRAAAGTLATGDAGRALGAQLAATLPHERLRHVLLLADGLRIAADPLLAGLADGLPAGVVVSGGLGADGPRFHEVLVGLDGVPGPGGAVAIGFYGDRIEVGTGAVGGWELFGPDRLVTRASGNVVYEFDGEPALALYKRYLGPLAAELPASGLLFPLALRTRDADTGVVRSVSGVDEAAKSVHFAGDVPEGMYVRMMKANHDRLIDGAGVAAALATPRGGTSMAAESDVLSLLISCVGRRWVLGQRAEEELEAVRDALGTPAVLAGFYSYGELAPVAGGARGLQACMLHNQTMTVTTFCER